MFINTRAFSLILSGRSRIWAFLLKISKTFINSKIGELLGWRKSNNLFGNLFEEWESKKTTVLEVWQGKMWDHKSGTVANAKSEEFQCKLEECWLNSMCYDETTKGLNKPTEHAYKKMCLKK